MVSMMPTIINPLQASMKLESEEKVRTTQCGILGSNETILPESTSLMMVKAR